MMTALSSACDSALRPVVSQWCSPTHSFRPECFCLSHPPCQAIPSALSLQLVKCLYQIHAPCHQGGWLLHMWTQAPGPSRPCLWHEEPSGAKATAHGPRVNLAAHCSLPWRHMSYGLMTQYPRRNWQGSEGNVL